MQEAARKAGQVWADSTRLECRTALEVQVRLHVRDNLLVEIIADGSLSTGVRAWKIELDPITQKDCKYPVDPSRRRAYNAHHLIWQYHSAVLIFAQHPKSRIDISVWREVPVKIDAQRPVHKVAQPCCVPKAGAARIVWQEVVVFRVG